MSQESGDTSSRLRELFEEIVGPLEALADMASPEDASQLQFSLGLPKERNQELANLAARVLAAMRPIQLLKNALSDAFSEAVNNPSNTRIDEGGRETT